MLSSLMRWSLCFSGKLTEQNNEKWTSLEGWMRITSSWKVSDQRTFFKNHSMFNPNKQNK